MPITVEYMPRRTPRTSQLEALFDAPAGEKLAHTWSADLPLDERPWNIGLIVGPSGAGKTTVARHLFGDMSAPEWPEDEAIVDAFPKDMLIKEITGLLSSVGLGSIPSWLRPYHTLSTGEQFRADVARQLAEHEDLAVVDEWTSTVDRQVAKVTSAATAKTVRKSKRRLVAVSCHYDIVDWLQPEWVYEAHLDRFSWRSVQPRPTVEVEICQVDRAAWPLFRHHHYLSGNLVGDAFYCAFVDGEAVAFAAVTHAVHRSPRANRIRKIPRLVVLPDWQGLGIGTRMEEHIAEHYAAKGFRFRSLVVHPGLVRHYLRSPRWTLVGKPGHIKIEGGASGSSRANPALKKHQGGLRMMQVWSFEYRPEKPPQKRGPS
jgi:ABC-type lipoprotein export system ATPase subunit/GNAT superfamily N-acetyltransferase